MSPDQTASPLVQFVPGLLIFAVFYFLLIKPQRDHQKKQKKKLTQY